LPLHHDFWRNLNARRLARQPDVLKNRFGEWVGKIDKIRRCYFILKSTGPRTPEGLERSSGQIGNTGTFRGKPRQNGRACGRQYLRSAICATRSKGPRGPAIEQRKELITRQLASNAGKISWKTAGAAGRHQPL
jgi:hypothetical protein